MPNLDEKNAFEHGIIATSKLLEAFAREAFKGYDGIACFVQDLALAIGDSASTLSECYSHNGFERRWKMEAHSDFFDWYLFIFCPLFALAMIFIIKR